VDGIDAYVGFTSAYLVFDCLMLSISFLRTEAINCVKKSLEEISGTSDWKMTIDGHWPKQNNGSDCGVFTAVGCECVAFDVPMRMNSDRSVFFRRKIAVDIMNQMLV